MPGKDAGHLLARALAFRVQGTGAEREAFMKKASNAIHYLAWLFVICLFMVGNVFSMELIFNDAQYSFQTLRALGYAVSGGADIGEVLNTAYLIKEGDDESWYRGQGKGSHLKYKIFRVNI